MDSRDAAFWAGVSLAASRGTYALRVWIWRSSFPTDFSARPGKRRMAALNPYWVMTKWVATAHCSSVRSGWASRTVTMAAFPVWARVVQVCRFTCCRMRAWKALCRDGSGMAVGRIGLAPPTALALLCTSTKAVDEGRVEPQSVLVALKLGPWPG